MIPLNAVSSCRRPPCFTGGHRAPEVDRLYSQGEPLQESGEIPEEVHNGRPGCCYLGWRKCG